MTSPNLSIRPATGKDARSMAEIHVAAWRQAYRGLVPDRVLDSMSVPEREGAWREIFGETKDTSAVVAELEGSVRAFCTAFCPSRDMDAGARTGEVAAIYVSPESWRRGLGRALLSHAIDDFKQRNFSDVTLWVFLDHAQARAFYDHFGFVPDGKEKVHAPSGQKTIRLRLKIGDKAANGD